MSKCVGGLLLCKKFVTVTQAFGTYSESTSCKIHSYDPSCELEVILHSQYFHKIFGWWTIISHNLGPLLISLFYLPVTVCHLKFVVKKLWT